MHMTSRGLSDEQRMMRDSCRAFVDDFVTPYIRSNWQKEWSMTPENRMPAEILQRADEIGIRTLGVPEAYGGTGWNVSQRFIFDEELERAGAPNVSPMGLLYVAPVIYTFGTQAQKDRWLGDILASRTFWAQGYSEPDAGSDLASLRTRAAPSAGRSRCSTAMPRSVPCSGWAAPTWPGSASGWCARRGGKFTRRPNGLHAVRFWA